MKINEVVKDAALGAAAKVPAPVELASDERNGSERVLKQVVTKRVKTLKELAKVCGIDLREWEIYRWKCGAWSTGMKPWATGRSKNWKVSGAKPVYSQQFVVQAWMRPRVALIAATAEVDGLRRLAASYAPVYPKVQTLEELGFQKQDLLCEYSIFDHHFGTLIWGKETGGPSSDIKIQRRNYEDAMASLIGRMRAWDARRALLILGNDQQNVDNRMGTTTAGTPQQTDVRYQKVFAVSRDASIWAVEALLAAHELVDVVMVSGNHDALATWHLGDSLSSWFRNNKRVRIDNRPRFRKYYRHGVNMLMFTHGNTGKLEEYDKTMAAEEPEMWGRTLWREAHTGDKHHRRLIELKGASVRILPSLRPPDAWTSEHHYVGSLRAAESYIWSAKQGLLGTSTYSILKG